MRHNNAWREPGLSPFIMPDYLATCRSPSVRKGISLSSLCLDDLTTPPPSSFREYALRRINEGARSILVDFGGTTFIASMGIGALIVPTQEVSRNGGRLAIIGLSPQLRQLFEVTGLFEVFQVYSTAAEASADGVWP